MGHRTQDLSPTSVLEPVRRALTEGLFNPLDGILWEDWMQLLKAYGRRIPPRYWPRVAFTSAMALLNGAVARWDRQRESEELADLPLRSPVFVLGHHRSGTTHLWNLLAQGDHFAYPTILQAVFPHSFLTFEPVIRTPAKVFTPRKRPQDQVALEPDSPIEEERALCTSTFVSIQMARHFPEERQAFEAYLTLRHIGPRERARWVSAFRRFARKLALRHGVHKTLLFKSPEHTARIRTLLEVFPDARFVHIHRDPFQVYASTLDMEEKTGPLYAFQSWPSPRAREDFVLWRYRAMYEAFFDDLPRIPNGRLAQISYSQLRSEPMKTLEQVHETWGTSFRPRFRAAVAAYLHRISDYRTNRRPELSEATKARVVRAWRPMFEHFGYDTQGH